MAQTVLADAQSLMNDAMFRAGEVPGASDWDNKVLEYFNREYRALCAGASEFLPEYIHDWWWMRKRGILILQPAYTAGSVAVTTGSANVVFSTPPAFSMNGYRLRVIDNQDVYIVQAHTAGNPNATLDSIFTGITSGAAGFKAMKVTYTLDATIDAIMSPLAAFDSDQQIIGLAPERMEELWPISRLNTGVPMAYCIEDEQTIRFSHGGTEDGISRRMEYVFRPSVDDLTKSPTSIPLLPLRFRHVLSDMTLVYLYMDKNDDRLTAIGTSVRSALGAMVKENRRRISKVDRLAGKIQPRQGQLRRSNSRLLRTESGLIIG